MNNRALVQPGLSFWKIVKFVSALSVFYHYNQQIMALFNFFRTPKPIRFDYKPRYWDQEKEEKEKRMERLESIQGQGIDGAKARISEAFSKSGNRKLFAGERRQKSRQASFIRLALILLLALIAYLALTVYLPRTGGLYFE